MSEPKRGEIWRVDFDPSIGHEIQKMRPAIVVSIDITSGLDLSLAVPLTSWKDRFSSYPFIVPIEVDSQNGLTKKSAANSLQVKSLSINRFVEKIGVIKMAQLNEIVDGIALIIDHNP